MKIPPSSVSSSATSSSPPSPSAATSLEISVMEGKPSPHLKKVLKSYQLTAANTLSGPNSVLSRLDHNGSSNSNIGNNSSAAPPSSASQGGNNSAVNIIASSLAASHGSLISGPPHFGLKIEKCVKALQSGEMHNNQNSNAGNINNHGPMKLSTVLKSRMENGSTTVGRPTSPESQDRDRDKLQGHPKESNSGRASPASVICIEREIKKEPEEEGIIKSSKYSHHHLHLRHSDDTEIGDGGILQGGKSGSAIANGRNSSTSFTTSSDSRSESSCSPVNTSSPVATINMNAINHLASPPPHPPQSVSAPGASYAGNYPTRKDRLREHTPDEMMAATALAFAKELPPEGLHVTREVIQVGSSPIVVGVKGHHSLHRSASVSTVDMPPPSAVSTPPSPHIASVVYQPQPPPILSAPDRSRTEKLETLLEGEYISCFVVGGEKRLCFPQILTSVLRPFTLHQINQVCDELQIFCSRCSSDQLEVLKVTGVIPMNAHSCGLITKTDAERLVNSLLHRNPPKSVLAALAATGRGRDAKTANSFRVYHECFGKCKGVVMPLMYDKPDALCVECVECHGLFSPIRFVAHSHKRQENRTCHWGFDSANWRHYLMLSRDQDDRERWEKALEDFKGKFEHKRKESSEDTGKELDDHVVIKKVRYSSPTPMTSPTSSVFDSTSCLPTKKRLPFLQYSDNDQSAVTGYEMDSVKKLVLTRMGPEMGAETVIRLLDKMSRRISSLEQICKTQEKTIRDIADTKSGAELQAKVNTMEAELHSLKKQLLRRHGQREEI